MAENQRENQILQYVKGLYNWNQFKKLFKEEESKFCLITSLKMVFVPFGAVFFTGFLLKLFIDMNIIFFEANESVRIAELSEAYYGYALTRVLELSPYLAAYFIAAFFLGIYVTNLLLRPFKTIGDYCEDLVEGRKSTYNPDFFTDLKLLTSFSEFFFNTVGLLRESKRWRAVEIPAKYTKIHKPSFEKGFFIQYFTFLMIIPISMSVIIHIIAVETHGRIVELSISFLKGQKGVVEAFLGQQAVILDELLVSVVVLMIVAYVFLSLNLYNRVSGPAFGVFATMRSFLKGNYNARVHLIGYYYVRKQCRKLNKCLDHFQRDYEAAKKEKDKDDNNGSAA